MSCNFLIIFIIIIFIIFLFSSFKEKYSPYSHSQKMTNNLKNYYGNEFYFNNPWIYPNYYDYNRLIFDLRRSLKHLNNF